jgi:radical SAM superfamily enzyme YgiQ (UPF0313 family)
MHVLLIQPSQFRDHVSLLYGNMATIEQPPMGLAMLGAALLKADFEVDILDVDARRATVDEITAVIDRQGTKLVGLSVTTPIFKNALHLCEQLKTRRPEVKTCLGGYHPSMEPVACVQPDGVDYVVKGEGERTIVELARAVEAGPTPERLRAIDGLYFKDQGKIMANRQRALIADLDCLPFSARHLFDRQRYSYPDAKYTPAFPLYTSRGCPGRCSFCLQQHVTGRKLRVRSAKNVADEVGSLISDFGARELHVWDDMFTCNKRRVFEIRDEFQRRGFKIAVAFTAGIRVDTVSPEVLQAMREMGGYAVAFGVESGDQEILDRAHKGITLDEVRRAVALAKGLGFETWCFFMLGLMGETAQTIEKTIAFAQELDPDVAKFHILKPYPGSEIHEQMKAAGLILDFEVENYGIHTYPVHRTEALSAEQIYRYQQQAYRRFYLRPSMIAKHLRRLNSWTRCRNNVSAAAGVLRLAFSRQGGRDRDRSSSGNSAKPRAS